MLVEQFGRWLWHIMGGSGNQIAYSLLIFVSVALVTYLLYLKYSRILRYKLPPGPWGLPFCGYIPFIKGAVHLHFNELAKKYGGIFSVSIGSELTVVISDHLIIRDSFRREEFTGRPSNDFMNIIDGYGLINTEGALWKDQRKFIHNNLRKFGMNFHSSKNLESKVMCNYCCRDVMLNDYMIPAGTSIVSLLYAVHMDPELWDEPEAFRPSRFLSADGKVSQPPFFMPFGVGRRKCLGEILARMEIFLFFTSLMHMFNLSLPEGAPLPSLEGIMGVTVSPTPFKVCLLQRDLHLADWDNNEVSVNGPLRNIGSH
ncbi:PREDICTED: cytochrome P450 18a1 [Trachymyrmex cornetzi]|uniref:cytochrome P450 18a1 n=1 Tax=Trachymyrmex cornetzi TaxID=471704 RepID=UPI00084EEF5A|nr:PREDICTED: cytochrome P450 18a1 [Trachymyrmex cornetzi]